MRPLFLLLAIAGCTTWSAVDTTGVNGTGGKSFSGPPALQLGAAGSTFAALQDLEELTLDPVDGGHALRISVRARNVVGEGAVLRYALLDTGGFAPLGGAAEVAVDLQLVGGACEALGVPLTVSDPTAVWGKPAWLDVRLVDRDGREAVARGRIRVSGGPDGGVSLDGGAPDASDGGTAGGPND